MPITNEIVEDVGNRYAREIDRFRKLTRLVEDACTQQFIEKSGMLVNITARTKGESSLRKKLRRMMERSEKFQWNSVDDVFNELSDFSGVRIAYYSNTDKKRIEEGLGKIFKITMPLDHKDKYDPNSSNPKYYKATHCQVALHDDLLEGDNSNLYELTCEIQICSMMEHVWNEIEHDIGYKPKGLMSHDEMVALDALGKLSREGDGIIEKLINAHLERLKHEDRLDNTKSLIEFVVEMFDIRRITFQENAGGLFETLQRLKWDNKEKLRSAMGFARDSKISLDKIKARWKFAQNEIGKFNRFLNKNNCSKYALNKSNSLDPVLMLTLIHSHKEILRSEPAGWGKGRPSRIRSLASRYDEYLGN